MGRSVACLTALITCLAVTEGAAAAQAGVSTGRVRVGADLRTYRLFVPPEVRPSAPLIVALHGGGSRENGTLMARATGLEARAARAGAIVVFPDADRGNFDGGRCCGRSLAADLTFVDRLVARIRSRHSVDRRRVFATGFSTGGFMSYALACRRAELFSAVAVVEGTEVTPGCRPSRPVSVLHIHSRKSGPILYELGRFDSGPIPQVLARWRRRDGCGPVTRSAPGPGVSLVSARCADRTRVQLLTSAAMVHEWPGALDPYGSGRPTGIDASDAVMAFFANLPRRGGGGS